MPASDYRLSHLHLEYRISTKLEDDGRDTSRRSRALSQFYLNQFRSACKWGPRRVTDFIGRPKAPDYV